MMKLSKIMNSSTKMEMMIRDSILKPPGRPSGARSEISWKERCFPAYFQAYMKSGE